MTDIFDMAAQRTPLRIINEGPPASRSRPASHVPAEEQVQQAPPSAGAGADACGVVKTVDVACSSSSCVRSPRSRLSPRAIVGRPESRQGDLHLAALPPSPRGMSADLDDNWRILLLDVARHMLINLQQRRGY
jgi:hypothetical protein